MTNTVVKIEMSGNRYNAWDFEGNNLPQKSQLPHGNQRLKPERLWRNVKVRVVEHIGGKFQ